MNVLKNKILKIKSEMEEVTKEICNEKFWIDWYGAYEIDPKYLVFWVCVQSDLKKIQLQTNDKYLKRLRHLLIENKYPESAINHVFIGIESQETVNRESEGNWYIHFK